MLDEFRKCINCPCGKNLIMGVWIEDRKLNCTVHDSIINFVDKEDEGIIRQAVLKINNVLEKIVAEADK